ncbi:MAG: hypothetical protein ACREUZ_17405 [Burkholderiales bacterium]
MLLGQTVSAIDGSATGLVSIQLGNRFAIQSDAEGHFQVDVGGPGTYATAVTGSKIVERHTSVTGPTADRTKISLIPSSFDLQAFDEMFRGSNSRLQRWTTRPSLVVVGAVMKYVRSNTDRYEASGDRLTDDEVALLVAHLTEGLTLLTGGTYPSFASVEIEWPQPGEQVTVRRQGTIVIGRYNGINTLAQTIGYGSWAEQPDGTVAGGSIWLDREFDTDDARRRLLRIHELGHALGYNHVTLRTSVMNPAIGPEPTDADRAGAAIAFQRPVGNTSPDTDPTASARTFSVAEGTPRWRVLIP